MKNFFFQRALDVDELDSKWKDWEELRSKGSVTTDKDIAWPKPYVLQKGDAEELAVFQFEIGYVGDPGDAPIRIDPPFDWACNPYKSRPWRSRLMCLQPVDAYIYAFQESGNLLWLKRALSLFFDWIQFFEVNKGKGYMAWADMPVGYRAIKIAYFIDMALRGAWEPNKSQAILMLKCAESHLKDLVVLEKLSLGNHGLFQIHGLTQLAGVYWNTRHRSDADKFIEKHLRMIIERQFNDEGVHLEHSPNYHWWLCLELKKILQSGWHTEQNIEPILDKAEEVKYWLLDTEGRMLQIGDTSKSSPPPCDVSLRRPDFKGRLYEGRCFPKGGIAVAKNDNEVLFFHASYHSKAHKHADDLHFDYHAFGKPILVDAGSTGYKMDKNRAYVLSTRAHNTVQVDQKNYPRDGTDSFGSALSDIKFYDTSADFTAVVNHTSLGVRHERNIQYYPGIGLNIFDFMESAQKHEYKLWLNFHPRWNLLEYSEDGIIISDGSVELLLNVQGTNFIFEYNGHEVSGVMNGWRAIDKKLAPSLSLAFMKTGKNVTFHTTLFNRKNRIHHSEILNTCRWRWEKSSEKR